MNSAWVIVIALLLLAAGMLLAYFVRLIRRSREVQRRLDFSKIKKWDDDW